MRLKVLRSKSESKIHATIGTKEDENVIARRSRSNLKNEIPRYARNDAFGARIKVKGGRFLVNINSKNSNLDKIKIVRDLLSIWYKKHARKVLLERVKIYSKKMKVSLPEIILANQTERWGSCNGKGRIRLNWHIIMAPMSLVDYVVAHELCHLRHNNHSEKFWKLLGTVMPDYEVCRERLRKEGAKFYF